MGNNDQRRVRALLIGVFVPVLIVVGLLATAVLGDAGGPARERQLNVIPPVAQSQPQAAPAPAPATTGAPAAGGPAAGGPAAGGPAAGGPAAGGPAAGAPAAGAPAAPPDSPPPLEPSPEPAPESAAPPAPGNAPPPPPPERKPASPAEPKPKPKPRPAPDPEPEREPGSPFVPAGAERIDVGVGARSAAIFRPQGAAGRRGPVVIFLHGWVAIDPGRYGPWIGHLVRDGATVIYPAYQTKPAYDTIAPLADLLAGVRAAFEHVQVAPGRLVVAGHSAGGALAADYAAVARSHGLPTPSAVFSVYPGRKLRHLAVPIPTVDLRAIRPGTRVLVLAGERDTAVGSGTAHDIVERATNAGATLQIIRDDAVDDHSAPRRYDGSAQRTFWTPLDALIAGTARTLRRAPGAYRTR